MAIRKRGNALEKWEIALIKAMIAKGDWPNDQDILAYFTRPTRSVNHRAIAEIRKVEKHAGVKPATTEALGEFLTTWPDVDPHTGLSIRGDELLIKSREAIIAAVHIFNSAGLTFRSELFIVTSVIGWTYLLHAWFRREGVDFRYIEADGSCKKTKQGEDCYWELGKCLRYQPCPIPSGTVKNLEFLIELRNEIEHRSTSRIDDAVSAKLQACCINFNDAIKALFGAQYGLERRLPIALQFVTFDADQRTILKKASSLPHSITTMMNEYHQGLTDDQQADPRFAYRVAFVPKVGNRASNADLAIEFIKPDSSEGKEINILLKDVNKKRYTATKVVEIMHAAGFPKFKLSNHTELWQTLDAKQVAKGFGCAGDYSGTWVWWDTWVSRVTAHCQEKGTLYC